MQKFLLPKFFRCAEYNGFDTKSFWPLAVFVFYIQCCVSVDIALRIVPGCPEVMKTVICSIFLPWLSRPFLSVSYPSIQLTVQHRRRCLHRRSHWKRQDHLCRVCHPPGILCCSWLTVCVCHAQAGAGRAGELNETYRVRWMLWIES